MEGISNIISICVKNGLKVYPVIKERGIYIQMEYNGRVRNFDKKVSGKKINEAMDKTYRHYFDKYKKQWEN